MAENAKTGDAQRGIVCPPNEAGPGGNRATNSYLPLAGGPGPLPPENRCGGPRGGSYPLDPIASPVHVPDCRFDVERAKMPQPPSAIAPGKGAIPVDPAEIAGRSGPGSVPEILREPCR